MAPPTVQGVPASIPPVPTRPANTRRAASALGRLAVLAAAAFAAACAFSACSPPNLPYSPSRGATTPSAHPSPAAVVNVGGVDIPAGEPTSFAPSTVTIRVGQSVEWRWVGSSEAENVTFLAGKGLPGFHSPTQTSGTYYHTFTVPGVYHYVSTLHLNDMRGEVIVKG